MKQREQALVPMRKAAQDEALLDAVIDLESVTDEIFGFHCQQAAETHDIEALMAGLRRANAPLPAEFEDLGVFTPFAAFLRYTEIDTLALDR